MDTENRELAEMHLRNWSDLRRAVEAWIVKRGAELRSRAEAMNQQTGESVSFHDDTTYYLNALLRVAEYERERADALERRVETLQAGMRD